MKILGISAWYHDSAAAIVSDEQIIAAAQEERFTRKKHDDSFPSNAIQYCLDEAGIELDELDYIAFYDKPLLKFERLLETSFAIAPKGLPNFVRSMPVWMKEKLFMKREVKKALRKIGKYDPAKLPLLFPEHHLSHAASAFFPSVMQEAAILTVDGVGEWATGSICHGKGREITILREQQFPHSLGLLYSAFTDYLGFRVNSGEYKLMGLAPYGEVGSQQVSDFKAKIYKELVQVKADGSIWMNAHYFSYLHGTRMTNDASWQQLFGLPRRKPESEFNTNHCNLGLAIQEVTEEIMLKQALEAKRLTGSKNLCLAGGVALNCAATGKLLRTGEFDHIFVQPAAGDAGGALGSALAALHIQAEQPRYQFKGNDAMQGAYLGPAVVNDDLQEVVSAAGEKVTAYEEVELYNKVAQLIKAGKVVGWVQGRMEYGPRALGRRSILADPGNKEMQKRLNLKVKYRESFRPFAPAVLEEEVNKWFDHQGPSPYMTFICPVQKALEKPLPENYEGLGMMDKLYTDRSTLPAITHVNNTARIQTVSPATNPEFSKLLEAFRAVSGYAVLVNTSFNVRGEPIVCTASDAWDCFNRTDMDVLVIDRYLFTKD